jgi:alkylation response protein AidB-like acyl-CoA dehydrogenase
MAADSDSRAIATSIRRFAREGLIHWQPGWTAIHTLEMRSRRLVQRGCQLRVFSAFSPRRYGGNAFGPTLAMAMEELGAVCSLAPVRSQATPGRSRWANLREK